VSKGQKDMGIDEREFGIISFFEKRNYGSMLQAYALSYFLTKLGCKCKYGYKKPNYGNKIRTFYHTIVDAVFLPANRKREISSLSSVLNCMQFSNQNDLALFERKCKGFVVGSDQVWNPVYSFNGSFYFLKFAAAGKKKIGYAISCGGSNFDNPFFQEAISVIPSFDYVSFREKDASDFFTLHSTKKCPWVLDPTFLVSKEEWLDFSKKSSLTLPKKKYLFVYYLPSTKNMERAIFKKAKQLAKRDRLQIVVVGRKPEERLLLKKCFYSAGPYSFVALLNSAQYVLTNSFHGTCFSIIFEKKFLSFVSTANSKGAQNRLLGLLEACQANSALVNITQESKVEQLPVAANFKSLESLLAKSKEELANAIQEKQRD
jgi:hypothetical protein